MPPVTSRVLLLLILLAAPRALFGLDPNNAVTGDYGLKAWETDDGLPHNSISDILQRSDGFLWVATQGGLVRFDGLEFTSFRSPLIDGVKSASVVSLLELDPQTMLIASHQSGLLQLRAGELSVHPLTGRFAPKQKIVRLFYEGPGVFWIIFQDREAWRCENDSVQKFPALPGARLFWPATFARDIDGLVYLSRGSGVERYDGTTLVLVPKTPTGSVTIAPSRNGGVWVAGGRRLAKLQGETLTGIAAPPPWKGNISPAALYEDRRGALWMAPPDQNLVRWKEGVSVEIPAAHLNINMLTEDDEGNLWVATGGNGLNRVQQARLMLVADEVNWSNSAGSISEDQNGTLWFANRQAVRTISNGQIETLAVDSGWPKKLLPIAPDLAGNLWFGVGGDLYRRSADRRDPPVLVETRAAGSIHVLFCARDGSLWVGRNSGALRRYLPDGTSETFDAKQGYRGRGVRAIGEDAAGHIWIGTEEGQLFEKTAEGFINRCATMGVPENAIRAIHGDRHGGLWVATAGAGLLMRMNERFVKITQEQGLPDDVISQILEDDFGWLWLGSRRGICRVLKSDLLEYASGRSSHVRPITYGRADGLSGISAVGSYQPTAWKTRSGRLWFVTRKGLVTADPAQLERTRRTPPVYLEQVLVDERPVDLTKTAVLSSARKIDFQFTAPTYTAPERVRFRYRLEGFESEWVENGVRRFATYPALPPGRYVFAVSASSGDREWSAVPATIAFQVLPIWWETWWARLLAVSAIVALLVVLVRFWSQRRLKARLARFEQTQRLEQERVRIARDLHDDLGASLTQASMMAEELSEDWSDIPDPKAHSAALARRVRTIARDLDAVVWTVSPKNDSLASLSAYLADFAEEYFRTTTPECRTHVDHNIPAAPLSPEIRHHLFMIAKELLNNVLKHARAKKIDLTMRMAGDAFELIIADDGVGFSIAAAENSGRNGLANLRSRAAEAGCSLDLSSSPNGTTATLRLPLAARGDITTISHDLET
jgi:signal transduction histidine kinase/ligand-binding sensor domain-containing protein